MSAAIDTISPPRGREGDSVTVDGSGFSATSNTVTVGGVSATVTAHGATQLTVTVPAGLTEDYQAAVVVTNDDDSTSDTLYWHVQFDTSEFAGKSFRGKEPGPAEDPTAEPLTDGTAASRTWGRLLAITKSWLNERIGKGQASGDALGADSVIARPDGLQLAERNGGRSLADLLGAVAREAHKRGPAWPGSGNRWRFSGFSYQTPQAPSFDYWRIRGATLSGTGTTDDVSSPVVNARGASAEIQAAVGADATVTVDDAQATRARGAIMRAVAQLDSSAPDAYVLLKNGLHKVGIEFLADSGSDTTLMWVTGDGASETRVDTGLTPTDAYALEFVLAPEWARLDVRDPDDGELLYSHKQTATLPGEDVALSAILFLDADAGGTRNMTLWNGYVEDLHVKRDLSVTL